MKRFSWIALAALLVSPACGDDDDDDDTGGTVDAAPVAIDAAASPDAEPAVDAGLTAEEERGRYLVNHVSVCSDCHTPRNVDGSPDMARFMAGNPAFIDIDDADDNFGLLPTPNLTPHATGLADWTDQEIKQAFLHGHGKDGDVLFPVMPYYVYHNMTFDDADAIVAYLRTLDPIDQAIPDPQPPFDAIAVPADPFPLADIPETTLAESDPDYESAQRGKYLATMAGLCMECHTPRTDPDDPRSLDTSLLFAGDEGFELGDPFGTVYSSNITQDDTTGLGLWTEAQFEDALLLGQDDEGDGLCPPMPAGPMGAFSGLSDADIADLAAYILSLPAISNEITADCVPPSM